MALTRGFSFSLQSLIKKHLLGAFIVLAISLSLVLTSGLYSQAQANPKYASIVMDADTGMILHQRHADKRLHPASLTKVMTLLLLFEAIDDGRVRLNDRIRISRRAASMQPSKLGLETGETIRVRDAIYSLVTKSANDVAVAVAEHLAGSESKFAKAMTRRAHQIGMARTTFRNASGLHNRRQISTARDIAKMARYVIENYPEYYKYFSRQSFTYNGKTYRNHNKLLGKYKGMDGMKTGYISAAGFNLVASAQRDGQRIIGVVFGGRSGRTRNIHMANLLDRGFKKMGDVRVASFNAPLPTRKPRALLALHDLNNIVPAGGIEKEETTEVASLSSSYSNDNFARMVGEGDIDPEVVNRIQTGLMAIAAHKGEAFAKPMLASYSPQEALPRDWSIQVGAFRAKSQSQRALDMTRAKLPRQLRNVIAVVAPLRTRDGWLYRARLNGYTRTQAFEACSLLNDCMPLAP